MSLPEKIAPQMPPTPSIVAPDENGAGPDSVKTPPPNFTVFEASLPDELGVARDLIRAIRAHQLIEEVDWIKKHKDILLTPEAVEKIRRALALISAPSGAPETVGRATIDPPPVDAPLHSCPGPCPRCEHLTRRENAGPPPGPKVEVFKVLRSVFKNTFMVSAFDPAEPKRIVWVRVKDNRKWVPGMEIRATHVQNDQYVLHGNNPRWRGKA